MTIIRTTFDREFEHIQADLVAMGGLVELGIQDAIEALKESDLKLAQKIIDGDEQVNRLRFKLEEDCLTLIATQQPAAGDLRSVIAAMYITVDLERMGDHVAGIAKTVILMSHEPLAKTIKRIPRMGELSRQMLNDCLQAFIKRDATWAREIADQDEKMDELYREVFDRLVELMGKKPDLIARATYLMWCAHNLERIADRVTNIAERVVFMTTGNMQELNWDEGLKAQKGQG